MSKQTTLSFIRPGGQQLAHRCRSRLIFGCAKEFGPNFPNLVRKVFVRVSPTNFLQQRTWIPFFGVTSRETVFTCFSANVGCRFLKTKLGAIFTRILPRYSGVLPKFLGILPGFLTNQNLSGCACTPTSCTTG